MKDGIRRAIDAIRDRYEEPLSLDDLARSAMISKFHFLRTFRRVTGVTPGRFLSAVRIHEAKHLLSTTTLSVAEISVQVGYGSLGTFTRRFTECVGLSPTAYRRVAQGEPFPEYGEPRPLRDHPAGSLSGTIQAVPRADSPVLVGVFDSPVPRGRPVTSVLVQEPGPWRLDPVPVGRWYVLAAAVGPTVDDRDMPSLLVSMSEELRVSTGRHLRVDLTIRPPDWRHPPLLSVLPGIERLRVTV
ncbi:AraC family transcriptional regulator [Micromonospora yasonensis]|uniref:helix-turn-helix domain-containing protein n=1 Tax=Micromonospora yasonensis TaxID=1128667 RepID=UPI00222E68A5|nr:AraC family transcriptional regulator [Micromonospora yasonensis]MCW3845024.1 AraC family transcriptional regulator [Micromonospora yasonensis]